MFHEHRRSTKILNYKESVAMRISFIFAWCDGWVGYFWDTDKRWLYILPIPYIGVILKFDKVDVGDVVERNRNPRSSKPPVGSKPPPPNTPSKPTDKGIYLFPKPRPNHSPIRINSYSKIKKG